MFQVRFHGRGGQGVVTAAELLAAAAFSEGRHAQAFPSFGSDRMGAPAATPRQRGRDGIAARASGSHGRARA
jgi:Pyruvate/2-oxoacid:ferredoxin oxidoreductase gamma subunit